MTNNRVVAEDKLNSPFEILDLSFALCRPALAHQTNQMCQHLVVAAAFFGGKLAGAFVQLRSHLGGFFRRTAEGDQDLGQFGDFHKTISHRLKPMHTDKKTSVAICVSTNYG